VVGLLVNIGFHSLPAVGYRVTLLAGLRAHASFRKDLIGNY